SAPVLRRRNEMCATRCGQRHTGENRSSICGPLIGFGSSFSPSITPNAIAVAARRASTSAIGSTRANAGAILVPGRVPEERELAGELAEADALVEPLGDRVGGVAATADDRPRRPRVAQLPEREQARRPSQAAPAVGRVRADRLELAHPVLGVVPNEDG